ncbi:MAG: hypothetical protein Q9190_005137 [Brigantiaea leucoxantha]
MPTGPRKPSIFRQPRTRLRLEWHRIKTRATELAGLFTYKYTIKKTKPRPKLGRRQIKSTAQALYRQMYTALAEGDVATLSTICTEGLLATFRSRIEARPPNERMRWTLHKMTHGPKIVSNRAGMLPVKGVGLRQVVVRLRSRQSLARIIGRRGPDQDAVVEGTGEEKKVQEYLVLQRRIWKGKEQPWMVWGTTQESPLPESDD